MDHFTRKNRRIKKYQRKKNKTKQETDTAFMTNWMHKATDSCLIGKPQPGNESFVCFDVVCLFYCIRPFKWIFTDNWVIVSTKTNHYIYIFISLYLYIYKYIISLYIYHYIYHINYNTTIFIYYSEVSVQKPNTYCDNGVDSDR